MVTIDDFEDGDVSEYGPDMVVQTTVVHSGTYAARVDGSDAYSTSGLANYPEPGDVFEVYMRRGSIANYASFAWGGPDTNNCYILRHDNGGEVYLYEKVAGSYNVIDSNTGNTYGSPGGDFGRYEVDWGADGTITVRVEDPFGTERVVLSGSSTEYTTAGGFGSALFGGGNGCYLDDAEITSTAAPGPITVGSTEPSGAADGTAATLKGIYIWDTTFEWSFFTESDNVDFPSSEIRHYQDTRGYYRSQFRGPEPG